MKKCIVILLSVILSGLYLSASEGTTSNYSQTGDINLNERVYSGSNNLFKKYSRESVDYQLSPVNLQLDVLGVLFYGPQIVVDFQFLDMIAVGPSFRWMYAGLLFQALITDWFDSDEKIAPSTLSFGGQAKIFLPLGTERNRPFITAGYERIFINYSREEPAFTPPWKTGKKQYKLAQFNQEYKKFICESESNGLYIGAGYRHFSSQKLNITAQLGFVFAKETKSIGYFEDDPEDIEEYELGTITMPVLQLVLGWQLGN